jgi:histidinol dehydrogenase
MVSPPRVDGSLHPALLVSAKEAGVDEVYRVGGPWSIFALAYGTESIPKVDLICGPGNIYVTLAKKLVAFQTGIDFLAGPSEVVVVADGSANPKFVVWDLLAQAEHDPESLSILITPSKKLAKAVKNLLPKEISILPRKEIVEEALKKHGAIIVVSSLDEAMELVNRIAPEHLELAVENPEELLFEVKNAGAVFLGHYTPEAMGDYLAGPNHVLPTMGLARFASALSADKFLKKINFLKYTKLALFAQAKEVITLANAESLFAHAQAVKVRLEENP